MRKVMALVAAGATLAACAKQGGGGGAAPQPDVTPVSTRIIGASGQMALSTTSNASAVGVKVAGPLPRVWDAVVEVYKELGLPTTRVDATTHQIGSEGLKVRRRLGPLQLRQLLQCGGTDGAPNAETYDILLTIHTTVSAQGDASQVSSLVTATGKSPNFSNNEVLCSSTGKLENEIGARAGARLKAQP